MLNIASELTGTSDPLADVYKAFVDQLNLLDDCYRLKSLEFSPSAEPLAEIEDRRTGRVLKYGIDRAYGRLLPRAVVCEGET